MLNFILTIFRGWHTHILKEGFFVKKFKKVLALSLALAMGLSLCACDKEDEKTTEATEKTEATEGSETTAEAEFEMPSTDGDVVYVYSWNTELGDRLEYFYAKYPEYKERVQYINLGLGGTSQDYIDKIETLIDSPEEESPSIICMDNDLVKRFAESDRTIAISDLGITDSMYADQYAYTYEFPVDEDGVLKALSWQVTPGALVYRTDIAEEVFGTSEPAEVEKLVKDWDTFLETAETLKQAGYPIVSGPDDVKIGFNDNKTTSWLDENDNLVIDPKTEEYMNYAKKLYDGGYTAKTAMWSEDWKGNAGASGDVFCYFGCPWFTLWIMKDFSGDHFGEWNMCKAPVSYHWGGSFLAATSCCKDNQLAGLVIKTLTCDEDVLYDMGAGTLKNAEGAVIQEAFVNNKTAVAQLIADGKGTSDVLGGQDVLEVWAADADNIDLSNIGYMDATLNGFVDAEVTSVNSGDETVEEAITNLKKKVADEYGDWITVE